MINSPADTHDNKEGGGEVWQVPEVGFTCSLWRRPWWSRYFPAALGETLLEQICTLQPGVDDTWDGVGGYPGFGQEGEFFHSSCEGVEAEPMWLCGSFYSAPLTSLPGSKSNGFSLLRRGACLVLVKSQWNLVEGLLPFHSLSQASFSAGLVSKHLLHVNHPLFVYFC